jgi:chloride channel protein, CIC family
LPIHWMWWPALGGLAVGLIGYFAPHTLGVGYDNIISILSGTVTILIVLRLFFFKFLSWAIALGSGTSGGTLAPLLTIGGAGGAILGTLILYVFPNSGINIPMAALMGMSAMFAGASRAYLTSITFALESTGQFHALLPLLGACTASYLVSFFLMENTIMTEKIARRGVSTPDAYEPDVLGKLTVAQVISGKEMVLNPMLTIREIRDLLKHVNQQSDYFITANPEGLYTGMVKLTDINGHDQSPDTLLETIVYHQDNFVSDTDSLRKAVELMSAEATEVLPVLAEAKVIGLLSYKNIIQAYKSYHDENETADVHISLKRRRLKVVIRGREMFKPGKKV